VTFSERAGYLLRTAEPDLLVSVHVEAFTALPDAQRERIFRRLARDLREVGPPQSASPDELARTAVAADGLDHGYLLRALRRPGQGVTEGHGIRADDHHATASLFDGSVLAPVASVVVGSPTAAPALTQFGNSPEAAQVDPSLFARDSGTGGRRSTMTWYTGLSGDWVDRRRP
jgi:hypothetical protein